MPMAQGARHPTGVGSRSFIRVYAEALSEGELASMLERANAAAISGSISATTKLEEQVTAKIQSYRMVVAQRRPLICCYFV